MNRREFLGAAAAISLTGRAVSPFSIPGQTSSTGRNLIPQRLSTAPNYWCTWAVQNYRFGEGKQAIDVTRLEGDSGAGLAHDAMNGEALFGAQGWAKTFHSRTRNELYLLLDDGWEAEGTATFKLDHAKFPSFRGPNEERLRSLNREAQRLGWRGAALWCRNTPGGSRDLALEDECSKAGISYWKIDIGDPEFNLLRVRNKERIPLTLEHVYGEPPTNGNWRLDGRFGPQGWDSRRMEILRHTDVYRTYDVTSILSLPTTLDRVNELLRSAAGHSEIHSLLNVEDEVYVAAVLGCTMGVMRHPLIGLRPGDDPDLFFNGPRKTKRRMDEVVRAQRWQRIAAPFAAGVGSFEASDEILTDGWKFASGETWQHGLVGSTVWQSAPAVIARNMALPEVTAIDGEKPFVFAARFPNGAVAVGVHERTHPGRGWYLPRCRVTVHVDDASGPFGIFGEFDRLTLDFDRPVQNRRLLAQDLAGEKSVDITAPAEISRTSVSFGGQLLREVGLHNRSAGDLSSPGLVLVLM
ncbi:hypothetical protein [Bryocella elongata]|nr:hypothetical protein [Bryocella elongata]